MITARRLSSLDELAASKRAYLNSVTAPLDGMWESGLIPAAPHWAIEIDDRRAGYFCVDDEHRLLQFHLEEPFAHLAGEAFDEVTGHPDRAGAVVKGAIVSTAEPSFLSLCLDRQTSVRVHSYVYHHHRPVAATDGGLGETRLETARAEEQPAIEAAERAALDADPGDWLTGYLRHLIERSELYVLRRGEGEVLGFGECRVSDTQPGIADLGVIVVRAYRRRGVAAHILGRLAARCHDRSLHPICSTTAENTGAQKAIARAGFVSRHRILEISFTP